MQKVVKAKYEYGGASAKIYRDLAGAVSLSMDKNEQHYQFYHTVVSSRMSTHGPYNSEG